MDQSSIIALIESQGLPEDFCDKVEQWYLPLVHQIASKKGNNPLVLGVQGSQGSGKSTLATFIQLLSEQLYQFKAVSLSLDDFYLSHATRKQLAEAVHPLFATRGVPGTHEVALAIDTIQALKRADDDTKVAIPRFNKALDDRHPESQWDEISGPVDLIIFEGWCVGCEAQESSELNEAANSLETNEDPDGLWRSYVNKSLTDDYPALFSLIDHMVVLQAPSFDCVFDWRWLQEQKLVRRWQAENPDEPARLLDEASVRRFISHYERLTTHCLKTLPKKADWVLHLTADHDISGMTDNSKI